MAFQLSPGVNVSEVDLTTVVPSVATSIGAFAGPFAWGPVNEITTVTNELELVDRFGKPGSSNYEYWFSAANFLAYSKNLKVVRASGAGLLNATSNGVAILIENSVDWETNHSSGANTNGTFAARYAGDLGNSLKVSMVDANTYSGWATAYKGLFPSAPATSDYVSARGGSYDEVHLVVVDEDGKFTGTAGQVLERFGFASKASDAKDASGNSIYYKNVIATQSKYIHWLSHPSDGTNWGGNSSVAYANLTANVTSSLSGGSDGTTSSGNVQTAYAYFDNSETVDVNLIIGGPSSSNATPIYLTSLAESRKDAIVFLSPVKSDVVNNAGSETTNVVAYRNGLTSSSFVVLDCNWKYQYDKYNDLYRWVPLNGDVAGLCARTDADRDPWWSPGGLNRGQIKNVIKLAWNPNKAARDSLYQVGVNPIVSFLGEGTVLYGDKTLLSRPSAFDRINVRRLFIVLEKAISKASRYSLFEFNDQFTRAQFVAMVEPFLRDVQGRRGITDFRVVCDETNNTAQVIDSNSFVGDIYVKPARSVNFIQLNFVAVRTGVSFNEVVGKF